MEKGAEKLKLIPNAPPGASLGVELARYTESLSRFSSTVLSHKRRAQVLLRYLEGTTSLVCIPLPQYHVSRSNVYNPKKLQNIIEERRGEAVFRIAEIAGRQGTTMLNLSMKTTWDARSMRTITVVALAYLPPTFVAVSNLFFVKIPISSIA